MRCGHGRQETPVDAPAMQVVMVPTLDLKPFRFGPERTNYRGHPREQVEVIQHSLRAFGQYKPVILSRDGYILAGEGVWSGNKASGEEQTACVYMPFPADDPQAAKLLVADNETSRLAQDDSAALAALLVDIQQAVGLEGTGHDAASLDAMIADLAAQAPKAPVEDSGPPEPLPEAVTRTGDVWGMRSAAGMEHRLVCGDCRGAEAWEKANAANFEVVFTSPPYNVGKQYGEHNDTMSWDDYWGFSRDWLNMSFAATRPGGFVVFNVCHLTGVNLWAKLANLAEEAGGRFRDWIVWEQPDATSPRFGHTVQRPYSGEYLPNNSYETLTVYEASGEWDSGGCGVYTNGQYRKPSARTTLPMSSVKPFRSDIWRLPASRNAEGHPAPFSTALAEKVCELYSPEGHTVCDCFMGSGTCLIACEKTGRRSVGIELEPRWVDTSVRRWQTATGREAVLEATGETWQQTAQTRGVD